MRTLVVDRIRRCDSRPSAPASFFQTQEAAEIALASLNHPQDRFLTYTLDQTMTTLKPFIK